MTNIARQKKSRNRKGQIGKTVSLILILAGAIVMYLVITKFMAKSTFDEAINTCRLSVIGQVATELNPRLSGAKSPFDINCDKRYVTFYNTKVELGLNPENMKPRTVRVGDKKVTKFHELSDLTVDQVVAEEMRICKYQFADGKVEVFANDDSIWAGKYICFICSEINFESTVKQQTFNTLLDYTQKTTFDDTKITYYEYLTEKSHTENILWSQPTYVPSGDVDKNYNNLTLDTSKKYYVFFEKFNPRAHVKVGTGKSTVENTDPEFIERYWVAVVPADEINTYCNFQAS